jgi:hypothetical protein
LRWCTRVPSARSPTTVCGGGGLNTYQWHRADAVPRAAHTWRVCQAWHTTSEVQVLAPGIRGAEGEEKGKGIHREVGSGGRPIHRRGATHRNRIGGVAHPGQAGTCPRSPPSAGDVLYQSGVYARNIRCLTLGARPVVPIRGTEGGAIRSDRSAEVSRGHRRLAAGQAREAPHGRTAGPQRGRAATRVGRRPERCPERG